jgi:hypothetical protein
MGFVADLMETVEKGNEQVPGDQSFCPWSLFWKRCLLLKNRETTSRSLCSLLAKMSTTSMLSFQRQMIIIHKIAIKAYGNKF